MAGIDAWNWGIFHTIEQRAQVYKQGKLSGSGADQGLGQGLTLFSGWWAILFSITCFSLVCFWFSIIII